MYFMKSACQYLAIHPTTYRGWGNSCNIMLNDPEGYELFQFFYKG